MNHDNPTPKHETDFSIEELESRFEMASAVPPVFDGEFLKGTDSCPIGTGPFDPRDPLPNGPELL